MYLGSDTYSGALVEVTADIGAAVAADGLVAGGVPSTKGVL
jgi:hypothetical protein